MDVVVVLLLGIVAGTVGGVIGFGSSVMLMPALVILYGPREAVPVMAVAAIMANLSRVIVWWREVDWKVCGAYSVTGIPAAALGAGTLLTIPPRLAEGVLGIFFLLTLPARRWMAKRTLHITLWQMSIVGALIGYITGIVVSTGPINSPFFLAYGLVKGAYLATEALGSLGLYISKAVTFRSLGALSIEIIGKGLLIGSSLMVGSIVAKRFVLKLEAHQFYRLIEGMLLLSGLTMIWVAVT